MSKDRLTDALLQLHSMRRALWLAREVENRERLAGHHVLHFDDTVTALSRQVEKIEREVIELVGEGVELPTGGKITVMADDRRSKSRPRVLYRPSHMREAS